MHSRVRLRNPGCGITNDDDRPQISDAHRGAGAVVVADRKPRPQRRYVVSRRLCGSAGTFAGADHQAVETAQAARTPQATITTTNAAANADLHGKLWHHRGLLTMTTLRSVNRGRNQVALANAEKQARWRERRAIARVNEYTL